MHLVLLHNQINSDIKKKTNSVHETEVCCNLLMEIPIAFVLDAN